MGLETWRTVWRKGIAPQLGEWHLRVLRNALVRDDPELQQGCTTCPPPLSCVIDWPVEGACVFGYCAWKGDGLNTVGEVEKLFSNLCFKADEAIGESAAVRYFLNWFDDTPRDEMRRLLLAEVELTLSRRTAVAPVRSPRRETAAAIRARRCWRRRPL